MNQHIFDALRTVKPHACLPSWWTSRILFPSVAHRLVAEYHQWFITGSSSAAACHSEDDLLQSETGSWAEAASVQLLEIIRG
jgi:hypothetical protein